MQQESSPISPTAPLIFIDKLPPITSIEQETSPITPTTHQPQFQPEAQPQVDTSETLETLETIDPDNPLLERVQLAIRKQLSTQLESLSLQFREKQEELTKSRQERQQVGVELYNLQQQLAKQQALVESKEDALNNLKNSREESDRVLKQCTLEHTTLEEKLNLSQSNLTTNRQELEKVANSVKQLERFKEELKSKLNVTKRSTLKTETDLSKKELEKKRQDFHLNALEERKRKLQEKRASLEENVIKQKEETKKAHQVLQDATTELDAVVFEKRQLLHQWKSSMVALEKRSEFYQSLCDGAEEEKSRLRVVKQEIRGFKQEMNSVMDANEKVATLIHRITNEAELVKKETEKVNEEKERLKDVYALTNKTLGLTEEELQKAVKTRNALRLQVESVQKQGKQLKGEIDALDKTIENELQNQSMLQKNAQWIKKDGMKLRTEINEKNEQIAKTKHALALLKMDGLESNARTEALKEEQKKLEKELVMQNDLIENYEVGIRRRNDDLAKKQSEVDKLNKKLDQLTNGKDSDNVGPLEATIHSLTKSLREKEEECNTLQRSWLKSQSELVVLSNRCAELQELIQELKLRITVATRKKMTADEQTEIRKQERVIKNLHHEMVKINVMLSKQSNVQTQLEETNLELEQSFRSKLKEAELECMQLEDVIYSLKEEKENTLNHITESEREIMLWEKKIQLAKETKDALDPNIGATEIKEMESEIHRMEIRLASLHKLQEKMVTEMEHAISRRESIHIKAKVKGKGHHHATLKKEIAGLTKKLKQTINDLQECDKDIQSLLMSRDRVVNQVKKAEQSMAGLEEKQNLLVYSLHEKNNLRTELASQVVFLQKLLKRYVDLKEEKYVFALKDDASREAEIEKQKEKLRKVEEIESYLEKEMEGGVEAFSKVRAYINASKIIAQ